MTPKVTVMEYDTGASMGFDNLLVEKICEKKPIEVVTIYNGQEDSEHRAGTAVSDVAEAKEGDYGYTPDDFESGLSLQRISGGGNGKPFDCR